MFNKLFPRQEGFFKLFQGAAKELVAASLQLQKLLMDLPNASHYAEAIKVHEKEGDKITRDTFNLLHKTFITPFDREDIHEFSSHLDDILDLINRTAIMISLYQPQILPEATIDLANLINESTHDLKKAIHHLDSLKQGEPILQLCQKIQKAKNTAIKVRLMGISRLLQEEKDIKELIKVKEVFEHLHEIVEECQDLANVIQGIVLEYS